MAQQTNFTQPVYPEGEPLKRFVRKRLGQATLWSNLFMLATLVGIIALVALLYNIFNSAFGYVALQNSVDPSALVLQVEKAQLLAAPNVITSEDDATLATGIAANPNAIGFFRYSYYQANANDLKLLGVENGTSADESSETGEGLTSAELQTGPDALALVVSKDNDFLNTLTVAQLRQIFNSAQTWADVSPGWPNEPIARFVPGAESSTLDFFVTQVFDRKLVDLPKETLMDILAANVSKGLIRRLENDQPFAERTQENVYGLVMERVVESKVVRSWTLRDSLLQRSEIEAAVAEIPNGELTFRSWITKNFLTAPQSSDPMQSGVRTAVLGSLWVILITILFALPVGVGAAVYLEEYATDNWFSRLVDTNINNLAGVPSIIYGMLGLAVFVRILEPLTSGSLWGVGDPTTANGRTVLSAGFTLGLLILPVIIINAREAIRAVPSSLRQASYGLGATQLQTIWHHVLPTALPGILTGAILAISRAIGETAPLVVIGASTFIVVDPDGPFAKFTTLPILIYQWTSRPQAEFRNLAAAAIVVLMVLLLTLNASAVLLRNRYSNNTKGI